MIYRSWLFQMLFKECLQIQRRRSVCWKQRPLRPPKFRVRFAQCNDLSRTWITQFPNPNQYKVQSHSMGLLRGLKGLCFQDTRGGPHKTNFAQKCKLEKGKSESILENCTYQQVSKAKKTTDKQYWSLSVLATRDKKTLFHRWVDRRQINLFSDGD